MCFFARLTKPRFPFEVTRHAITIRVSPLVASVKPSKPESIMSNTNNSCVRVSRTAFTQDNTRNLLSKIQRDTRLKTLSLSNRVYSHCASWMVLYGKFSGDTNVFSFPFWYKFGCNRNTGSGDCNNGDRNNGGCNLSVI